MNKLLLVAFLGCALLALTAGINGEETEDSIHEEVQTREVREAKKGADGRRSIRREKRKNSEKSKKKKKENKDKKQKGQKKEVTRKNKKGKAKQKNKNKEAKQKVKSKKALKALKRRRKAKKNAAKKKNPVANARQSTACTSDEECLTLAAKYMKQVKDKVKNFKAQKARIDKSAKLATSKAGKKGDFSSDLARLKEAGGGNASALTCQGKETGTGQTALKDAVDKLTACQDNIKKACETDVPTYNKTAADDCETKMTTFSDAVDVCTKESDATKICTCWKSADLKTAFDAIADCSLTTENAAFTTFKKACTSSFSTCRQTQDLASSVIYSCNAANSADKLISKLKDVTDNKASIDKLAETAKSKASGSRRKRAATCADFITAVKKVADLAKEFIASPNVKKMADAANADPPALCTPAEKEALTSAVPSLVEASTAADASIAEIQSTLQVQTGSTASAAVVAAATTASATKAPSGRRILRDMFHF